MLMGACDGLAMLREEGSWGSGCSWPPALGDAMPKGVPPLPVGEGEGDAATLELGLVMLCTSVWPVGDSRALAATAALAAAAAEAALSACCWLLGDSSASWLC